MKSRSLGLLLTCGCLLPSSFSTAHQIEADFNDMFVGNTMTRANSASENINNVNSGSGFLPNDPNPAGNGGPGEYNNNSAVILFERGDLPVPPACVGFKSLQEAPVDPTAVGQGIVFGSSTGTLFSRMQERRFAAAMTQPTIWFSYLFRLDGPGGAGQLIFNVNETPDSNPVNMTAAFAISMGHADVPGAIAINLNPKETPLNLLNAGAGPELLYYDNVGSSSDYNGNGQLDGVDVGKGNAANIRSHLIIGRISFNANGSEVIDVWLDPVNGEDPTGITPTLTATSDEIPAAGLTSIGFLGSRNAAPSPAGGPYTTGGHFSLDHVRISDNPDALDFVTGNVEVDPKLIIDTNVPNSKPNFNFQGIYGAGLSLTSASREVVLRNTGANNPITINSIGFETPSTATPPFVIESQPTLPLTLEAGQATTIRMHATSEVFEVTHVNSLLIKTSHPAQDTGIACAATFYSGGSRINPNPNLNSDIGGWLSDHFSPDESAASIVSPGFIGSSGMVRMKGKGDGGTPADDGGAPDNLSQTILNGAKDWEFTFFFSPIDTTAFAAKTGREPLANDRTFQVILQSNSMPPVAANGTLGKWTNAANGNAGMINLAYMPAGADASSLPGFYLFNGNNWQRVDLPAIQGSIDVDNNGTLNANPPPPTPPDTVRSYLMRIKGTDFGTSQAKYSISVSAPNSTLTAATAPNLAIWSASSGQLNTPGAYTFTTGDVSSTGGDSTFRTGFWFDEVSFFSLAARDPDFSLAAPVPIISHNGVTSSGSVSITNTGFNNPLEISGLSFAAAAFTSPQALPLTIPVGTTVQIPVNINPAAFTTTNNASRVNLTATGNVPLSPSRTVNVLGIATSTTNQLGNWNFEITGNDTINDNDSFAGWDEPAPATTNSKDVPGLTTGSNFAAYVGRNATISNRFGSPMSDFVIDLDFAIKDAGDQQGFFINVSAGSSIAVPLLYRSGTWFVKEGEGEAEVLGGAFVNPSTDANNNLSLNDPGDTRNVYKLRFTGSAWNTLEARYQFDILDSSGTVVGSSPELTRTAISTSSGVSTVLFQSPDVDGPAFWVDNVRAGAVIESEVKVTGLSKSSGGFTISWNSGGDEVTIERSTTLLPNSWENLPLTPTDQANASFNDAAAPADRAFYRIRRAD